MLARTTADKESEDTCHWITRGRYWRMAKLSLNIFLAKESYTEFDSVVEKDSVVRSIPLRESLGFEGVCC